MLPPWLDAGRHRGVEWDRRCAIALHRGALHPWLHRVMAGVSRLGDGPMWLAVLLLAPLFGGPQGMRCGAGGVALGAANLLVYWAVKRATRRERPFNACPGIRACVRAADPFSFPSGHTLHAVAFGIWFAAFYPSLAVLLAAFAVAMAASRVVLGVHYPSDVLAGAVLGATTATLAVAWLA